MGRPPGACRRRCLRHLVSTLVTTFKNRQAGIFADSWERVSWVFTLALLCMCSCKSTVWMNVWHCPSNTKRGQCFIGRSYQCTQQDFNFRKKRTFQLIEHRHHLQHPSTHYSRFSFAVNYHPAFERFAECWKPSLSTLMTWSHSSSKVKLKQTLRSLNLHSFCLSHQVSFSAEWRFTHPQSHTLCDFTQSILEWSSNMRPTYCEHIGSLFVQGSFLWNIMEET